MSSSSDDYFEVSAIEVNQWLSEWDLVRFGDKEHRRKPDTRFYIFSLPVHILRKLSGIYRRTADRPRSQDLGIQRIHVPKRSEEIRRFVHGGFPWSDLSQKQKDSDEFSDLRMPGWLPTSILVNILGPEAVRKGKLIRTEEVIQIEDQVSNGTTKLLIPSAAQTLNWDPYVPPIEIIDGQHRLLAFEDEAINEGTYELPVTAFFDLDITWQAYLFYMINIKPQRINASLAFDLYPILRIQDWLEKSPSGPAIYRETRAQELTEILWSFPESPWRDRISMLGLKTRGTVTQASFIRSLMASYVKRWEGKGTSIGGLFGTELIEGSDELLQWGRPQQAAFLILVWQSIAEAAQACQELWATSIRALDDDYHQLDSLLNDRQYTDPAFTSKYSLLATDQGVRGVLQVTNDICFVAADKLGLAQWHLDELEEESFNDTSMLVALESLQAEPVSNFLRTVSHILCYFDWRTSSFPDFESDKERQKQMIFRGSGGYREIRHQLLQLLASSQDALVQETALQVLNRLGYH